MADEEAETKPKREHLAFRADPKLRERIERIRAQYNPHAGLTEWLTAWVEHMVTRIETHGADHVTLLARDADSEAVPGSSNVPDKPGPVKLAVVDRGRAHS